MGTKPRHRKYGPGGVQAIAAAQDAAWRRAEERRAQEAEADQPPCTEDGQSVEVYREYAPGGTVSWGDTPCRYAGHPMHVCSDAYGGRVRPGTLCHSEARARLYERQEDLAGAVVPIPEDPTPEQWWRWPTVYCAACSHPWEPAAGVGHYVGGLGCLECGCTKAPPTAEDIAAFADLRADAEDDARADS